MAASPIGMEGGSKHIRAMLMCYVFHADVRPLGTTGTESNRLWEGKVYIRMLERRVDGWIPRFYVVYAL